MSRRELVLEREAGPNIYHQLQSTTIYYFSSTCMKTDSGTEPVSVGVVWLKKTSYIYHSHHVCKRSFYKIHESERLPLNYAFVKSISNEVWSDVICVTIWNANFPQQTENNSDPWHERKWHHMHVRLTVNHSTALKSFNQTTFIVLAKFAAPQIVLQ